MISGKAKIAGVMGWPVGHSRSPRLHNYWLQHYGIDGAYVPLPVAPQNLPQALRALPVLGFRGVNLTVPHKEAALAHMDHLDEAARKTGAVNTVIVRPDGSLEGRNTDVTGFALNLKKAGFVYKEPEAVVLGAGGAARAVISALELIGITDILVVNRTLSRAEKLAEELSSPGLCITASTELKNADNASLLVNATSLGMEGQPALEIDLSALPSHAFVADIVYTPLETALLRQARQAGYAVCDGFGMLLYQAQPAFGAWFGVVPEVTEDCRAFVLR